MINVIEGINQYIEERREKYNLKAKGHLVVKKLKTAKNIKAYKEYLFILYFVAEKTIPIFISRAIDRVINDQDKHLNRQLEINFIKDLTKFINSSDFNKVIEGTYGDTTK